MISYSENSDDLSFMLTFCKDRGLDFNRNDWAVSMDRGNANKAMAAYLRDLTHWSLAEAIEAGVCLYGFETNNVAVLVS